MMDKVRDLRIGNWAWFNKSIFKMHLGWSANLVYMGLVSFANSDTQSCYPSIQNLADMLDLSPSSIRRGLKILSNANLISVQHHKSEVGDMANEYTLLPIPDISGGGGVPQTGEGVSNRQGVGCPIDRGGLSHRHPNKNKRIINTLTSTQNAEVQGELFPELEEKVVPESEPKPEPKPKPKEKPKKEAKEKKPPKPKDPVDPRFPTVVNLCKQYWDYRQPNMGFPFNSLAGRAVRDLLSNWTGSSPEEIAEWFNNMMDSDDVLPDLLPQQFIRKVHLYKSGPHDKYGKMKKVKKFSKMRDEYGPDQGDI